MRFRKSTFWEQKVVNAFFTGLAESQISYSPGFRFSHHILFVVVPYPSELISKIEIFEFFIFLYFVI